MFHAIFHRRCFNLACILRPQRVYQSIGGKGEPLRGGKEISRADLIEKRPEGEGAQDHLSATSPWNMNA
jgi:hypothetical protein